jgi:hypothetical protein
MRVAGFQSPTTPEALVVLYQLAEALTHGCFRWWRDRDSIVANGGDSPWLLPFHCGPI